MDAKRMRGSVTVSDKNSKNDQKPFIFGFDPVSCNKMFQKRFPAMLTIYYNKFWEQRETRKIP